MTTAFLFPGQGSQYVGMGQDLYEASPEAQKVFDTADEVLDIDIKTFCFDGPEESLKQTEITQPAIFTHSIAAFEAIKSRGLAPDLVAGHSVGELAALVAAGVMSLEDGLRIVRVRGQAMQAAGASNPGTMAAILGLDDDVLTQLCDNIEGIVTPANFNCPGQIVISGEEGAISEALEKAKDQGAKRAVPLPVSGAFHSELMEPAVAALTEALNNVTFSEAQIPVIPNVTTQPTRDSETLKSLLIKQVVSPVRWTESMQNLIAEGLTQALEVGPGSVLKGLMRRIDRKFAIHEAGTVETIEKLDL